MFSLAIFLISLISTNVIENLKFPFLELLLIFIYFIFF